MTISLVQIFNVIGLLAGVYSLGATLLLVSDKQRLVSVSFISRFPLILTTGVALWSIPMLVTAMAGVYRATYFGVAGWLALLMSARFLSREARGMFLGGGRIVKAEIVVLAILLIAAILYLGFPTESPIILGDAGVYANHAVHIERTGRLDIPYKNISDAVAAVIDTHWYEPQYGKIYAPGFYLTVPTITVQFAHLLPVWLAQVFASFGFDGLIRFNALMALFSMMLFYGIAEKFMDRRLAVAAAFVFALNPGQIWMARTTLTEIITQLFLWSGLLLLINAFDKREKKLAAIAGLMIGLTGLLRIDSFLLVPLCISANFVMKIAYPDDTEADKSLWRSFYLVLLPLFACAYCYYVYFTQPYAYALSNLTTKIGVVTLISLGLHVCTYGKCAEIIRYILFSRNFFVMTCCTVVGLATYAYFIRPNLGDPYLIKGVLANWNKSIGMRDFREDSFVNLTKYISTILTWSAIGGFLVLIDKIRTCKLSRSVIVLIFIAGGYSILYLWTPSINPNHIYAIRRYIPVVIPCFIFSAFFFFDTFIAKFKQSYSRLILISLFVYLGYFIVKSDQLIAGVAEEKGTYIELKGIAEQLPHDNTILAWGRINGWGEWMNPLLVAFDCNIAPVNLESPKAPLAIRTWLLSQNKFGKSSLLLADREPLLDGYSFNKLKTFNLSRSALSPTTNPLPKSISSEKQEISLYEIKFESENNCQHNTGRRSLSLLSKQVRNK